MLINYKYRLKGKRTVRRLQRHAWACNQVWNYCVQVQRKTQRNYADGLLSGWPTYFDLTSLTANCSKELGIHAQTIQSVCKQFITSRDLNKKCPHFRTSIGAKRSLGWVPFQPQSRKITTSSVTYLKHQMHFFGAKRRPLPETAKSGVFVEDSSGRWYVCFYVNIQTDQHCGIGDVGIDLGLKAIVTSDNEHFTNGQYYRKSEAKLATAHRADNLKRTRAINTKIKNQRTDFLHKLSTKLIQKYQTIYVGDVNPLKIDKNYKLAKSVHDAGWSTLRNMLRYKASRHGAKFAVVDEKFTTQRCSCCGNIPDSSPKGMRALGIREWVCSLCEATHDRDVNAAKNILILGRSVAPLVEESQVAYGRQLDKHDKGYSNKEGQSRSYV